MSENKIEYSVDDKFIYKSEIAGWYLDKEGVGLSRVADVTLNSIKEMLNLDGIPFKDVELIYPWSVEPGKKEPDTLDLRTLQTKYERGGKMEEEKKPQEGLTVRGIV